MPSDSLSFARRFYPPRIGVIPFAVVAVLVLLSSALVFVTTPRLFWSGYWFGPVLVVAAGVSEVFSAGKTYLEITDKRVVVHSLAYSLIGEWQDVLGVGRAPGAYMPMDCLVLKKGQYTSKMLFGVRLDYFQRQRFPDIERAIPLQHYSLFPWRNGPLGAAIHRYVPGLTPWGWREPDSALDHSRYATYLAEALDEWRTKQRRFQKQYGKWLTQPWTYVGTASLLRFGNQSKLSMATEAVYLGNYAERLSVWQWAWGNLKVADAARRRAIELRGLAEATSMRVFDDPDPLVIRDEQVAWELAAVCVRYLGAEGAVRLSTTDRGTYAYFALCAPRTSA